MEWAEGIRGSVGAWPEWEEEEGRGYGGSTRKVITYRINEGRIPS